MRKKINILAVMGIFLLLALGYFVPPIVMAMEDRHLQSENKTFFIEEIELNFQNVDMLEELSLFSDMLSQNIIVEIGKETYEEDFVAEKEDAQQAVQEQVSSEKYQIIKTVIKEFLAVLNMENELEFEKISAINYVMMASYNDEKVYSVWKCCGVDEKEQSYCFWIDDFTRKVMAFEVPYEIIGTLDESFYQVMENVKEYYGFAVFGLAEHQENLYKSKYWQNSLMLLNEDKEEGLELYIFKTGETLYFNMYPRTISIYNSEDVKWTDKNLQSDEW